MSIEQICATRSWLLDLMHPDAILWLWVTNFHLVRYAAPVLDALGFTERSILTWVKNNFGHGDWLRSQTEHCILAVRGKPTVTLTNESTVLLAPTRGHSVKPPEFYALVESLCPAPRYLDVFSRHKHNDKWDCYGDQAPQEPPGADGEPVALAEAPTAMADDSAATEPPIVTADEVARRMQAEFEALPADDGDGLGVPPFLRRIAIPASRACLRSAGCTDE
jgi:N6-adenosine-specific RNA methylase IME4